MRVLLLLINMAQNNKKLTNYRVYYVCMCVEEDIFSMLLLLFIARIFTCVCVIMFVYQCPSVRCALDHVRGSMS